MSRLPCGPGCCRTGTHLMHCRDYVGPVVHRWMTVKPNATFGGMDHFCTCGGSFRRGGLAGHGEEPKCPNADETYRNPPARRLDAAPDCGTCQSAPPAGFLCMACGRASDG